jgi:hypothetical protein
MPDDKLHYLIRHRKFLEDWSKVIVLTEDFDDARGVAVMVMNSCDIIAEVSIYDPFMSRTSSHYPEYKDGERVMFTMEDIR